jgi:competence protein ComEC
MRLIYVTLAWCAGIVYAASLREPMVALWMIGAVSAAVAGVLLRRARWALVVAACFAFGSVRYLVHPTTSALAAYNRMGGATITGVVSRMPTLSGDNRMLTIAAESIDTGRGTVERVSGNVLVQAPLSTLAQMGDRVQVTGGLFAPSRYGNFSYADYLARADIYTLMRETSVEIVQVGAEDSMLARLAALRSQAAARIARAMPEPEAGLLTGILLGDESWISPALEDDFAATGAAHIVAISGFNMIVVSGVVTGVLARMRMKKRRAAILSIVVVAIYTIFVGASAAVVRAALMSGLLIVGKSMRRKTFIPASLAFSAVMLSMINPLTLWDVGFQLSFAAVMGIALFADALTAQFDRAMRRLLPKKIAQRLVDGLSEPLIVSLAATIATLPLTALYFGRVSVVTLAVNVIIVPLQSLVLVVGGLATGFALVNETVGNIVFGFVFVLLAVTIDVVRMFANLPFASIDTEIHRHIIAGFFAIAGWYMLMRASQPNGFVKFSSWITSHRVRSVVIAVMIVGAMIGIAYWDSQPDGRLHVWVLDVGHSHGVLIQTPGGLHILIDGGRYPSTLLTQLGDRLPFYKRMLDLLVITHPDANEYGALGDVTRRYAVNAAMTNGQPNSAPDYARLLETIGREKIVMPTAGYATTTPDGVTIEILNPVSAPETRDSFGVTTLVVRVHYGASVFLFPSDLSAEGQAGLLEAGVDIRATALIVPQHGAEDALDAAFVAAVAPEMALLQLDPNNIWGDPAPDALALLGDTRMYRTDEGGTIHIETDGERLTVNYEGW